MAETGKGRDLENRILMLVAENERLNHALKDTRFDADNWRTRSVANDR